MPRMWESESSPEWGPEADIPFAERLDLPEELNHWHAWYLSSSKPGTNPTEQTPTPLESATDPEPSAASQSLSPFESVYDADA